MKQKVLDKGFIEVVDSLGNDLTVVNSARVSFGKRKTKYDNPLLALQSARLASFRAKELIKDYKCRYCDGYHIGRVHRGI